MNGRLSYLFLIYLLMQTVHKFSLDEVKKLLREKHKIPSTEEIEVEDVKTTTITFPITPWTYTQPYFPPQITPSPSMPIYPNVWC